MTSSFRIGQEECPSHKHVDWKVNFGRLLEPRTKSLNSPVFSVGDQHYGLGLWRFPKEESGTNFWLCLRLYRKGPSAESPPVRWWGGLKRGDGTYSYRNKFGKLNFKKEYSEFTEVKELWRVKEVDLEEHYLVQGDYLTAFLHMRAELSSTRPEACPHSTHVIYSSCAGFLMEEKCTSHKRVEWNFKVSSRNTPSRTLSPAFEIANQRYILEFLSENTFLLLLYRMGSSVNGSVRWWAGLKHSDGTYHYRNAFGDLNLKEEFHIWIEAMELLRIESCEFNEGEEIKVFFQMKVEQSSNRAVHRPDTYTHDSPRDIFPPIDGNIDVKECEFHKHVEWIVMYDPELKYRTSDVFEAGDQLYRLMFRGNRVNEFCLFRLGPSDGDPASCVQWWAGLKRADETYHHKNESGKIYLQKECELWSEVAQLMPDIPDEMIKDHLARGCLTFVFWMTAETGAEECTHGRTDTPRGIGNIRVTESWITYKLLRWDFYFHPGRSLTSPIFTFDDQHYLLEMVCCGCDCHFHLYRMGRSVNKSVLWWVGVSSYGKLHHDHGSDTGKLNLLEACDLWIHVNPLHSSRISEEKQLLVYILMSLGKLPSPGEVCISDGEIHDSNYVPEEDVLFKVRDRAFRMRRAIIRFEVLRMEDFHRSISESGNAVVEITDCEPDVFEEFLEIIESGFNSPPSVKNALALYDVADKYWLYSFKGKCASFIKQTMSVDSFCDVVRLCKRHRDDDLYEYAISFLFRNREIIESDSFSNFASEDPDVANELIEKAFSLEE